MSAPPLTVRRTATIKEAAKVMLENKVGSLLVVDETGKLEGIITERDILQGLVNFGEGARVSMFMTENPITISPGASVTEAIEMMRSSDIRHLPVIDRAGVPIGIVSMRDVLAVSSLLMRLFHPS